MYAHDHCLSRCTGTRSGWGKGLRTGQRDESSRIGPQVCFICFLISLGLRLHAVFCFCLRLRSGQRDKSSRIGPQVCLLVGLRIVGFKPLASTSYLYVYSLPGRSSCYTDTCADLSFNLLSRPDELFLITCLQRLDILDVGCNEMCIHPEYHASVKAMRHRIGTLKKLNDEAVVNAFVGYGEDAAMQQHAGEARLAGLDRDNSRSFPPRARSLLYVSGFETCRRGAYREREREKERERE